MGWVSRTAWGARGPRASSALRYSAGFGVHWNGPPVRIASHDECDDFVRGVQRFHMDTRGWYDIAYNFLICPHGDVFVGRGWDTRSAANGTNVANSGYHAVMVMVGQGESVTDAQQTGLVKLVDAHRQRYGTVTVKPHSAFKSTACPGDELRRLISRGLPAPPKRRKRKNPDMITPDSPKQAVRELQQDINSVTADNIAVDGIWGPITQRAFRTMLGKLGFRVPDDESRPRRYHDYQAREVLRRQVKAWIRKAGG